MMRKLRNKQCSLFPGGIKKQEYNRGNPLTKNDKLLRIEVFNNIREAGGTLRDVAVKWGMSHNSSHTVHWKVRNYKKELGLK